MHHQPRRLVDHDQMLVLIGDDERDLLRLVVCGAGFGDRHREQRAGPGLGGGIAHQ